MSIDPPERALPKAPPLDEKPERPPASEPARDRGVTLRTRLTGAGLLVGLVLVAVAVLEMRAFPERATRTNGADVLLGLATTAPLLLLRGRWLWAAAALVSGANLITAFTGAIWTWAGIAGQLAVFYLCSARYGRGVAAGLGVAAFILLLAPGHKHLEAPGDIGVLTLLVVAALVLGDTVRLRREATAQRDASERAAAEARRDRAVMAERARIARELHDVVAHRVSMIAVQAETARLTTEGLSEQGQQKLRSIGDTAREAMTEMRTLLDVLRTGEAAAEFAPQPGLDRLDKLVEDARRTGAKVRLRVRGESRALPTQVDVSAYRILQAQIAHR
jgi:signal transduction histidine kinase